MDWKKLADTLFPEGHAIVEQNEFLCGSAQVDGQAVAVIGTTNHTPIGVEIALAQAEAVLKQDPFTGHLFVFRGRRGDLVKVIWWDGQGACMFLKRLEKGRFVWPSAKEGKVALTPVQLSMLLEGIDWRRPIRTAPVLAV